MNDEVETQGHNQKESVTQPFQRAKQICKKHKAKYWYEFTSVGMDEGGK